MLQFTMPPNSTDSGANRPAERSVIFERTLLVVCLPLLVVLGLTLYIFYLAIFDYQETNRVQATADLMGQVGEAIHALQVERGTSTAYVRSPGGAFGVRLRDYRSASDSGIAAINLNDRPVSVHLSAIYDRARQTTEKVTELRAEIDSYAVDGMTIVDRYAEIIKNLVDLSTISGLRLKASGIANIMRAHMNVTQLKEYSGLERATGLALIASESNLSQDFLSRLSKLVALQDVFIVGLESDVTFGTAINLNRLYVSTKRVEAFRSNFLAPFEAKDRLMLLEQWFEVSTARIDELRNLESRLFSDLKDAASLEKSSVRTKILWLILVLSGAFSISAYVALKGARSIAQPVREITAVLNDIAQGRDQSISIDASQYRGEMRHMAIAAIAFRNSQLRSRATVNGAIDAIISIDTAGRVLEFNPSAENIFGYKAAEAIGKDVANLLIPAAHREAHREGLRRILRGEQHKIIGKRLEVSGLRSDGSEFPVELVVNDLLIDGGHIFTAFISDISERKAAQAALLHKAHYDEITGLPNRLFALDRLRQAIALAKRNERHVGVLYLDIDNFKKVNDSLGHTVGDKLLLAIGRRLTPSLRESDTIARLGGDEFLILLTDIEAASYAESAASRICELLYAPFMIDGHEIFVTGSIGITVGPTDGDDPLILLKNADIANDLAKSKGRDNYRFYVTKMDEVSQARRKLLIPLYHALERNQFFLAFHPIIDARSGKPVGAEALIRWRSAELGLVGPDKFIALAEDTGLIVPIGAWVIREACRAVASWKKVPNQSHFRVAVNVSARQFRNSSSLVQVVQDALAEYDLLPSAMEIEITESVAADTSLEILPALEALANLGLRLSIDDFGTGYSSLSYLQRFPFHTLKIDRSFVSGASSDLKRRALLKAMIAMSHGLGLEVVAEGVELTEERDLLTEMGTNYLQGYLFSKPLVRADFDQYLEA